MPLLNDSEIYDFSSNPYSGLEGSSATFQSINQGSNSLLNGLLPFIKNTSVHSSKNKIAMLQDKFSALEDGEEADKVQQEITNHLSSIKNWGLLTLDANLYNQANDELYSLKNRDMNLSGTPDESEEDDFRNRIDKSEREMLTLSNALFSLEGDGEESIPDNIDINDLYSAVSIPTNKAFNIERIKNDPRVREVLRSKSQDDLTQIFKKINDVYSITPQQTSVLRTSLNELKTQDAIEKAQQLLDKSKNKASLNYFAKIKQAKDEVQRNLKMLSFGSKKRDKALVVVQRLKMKQKEYKEYAKLFA